MGTAKGPTPVKLIVSLLSNDARLLAKAQSDLAQLYGPVDFESEMLPSDYTGYYTPEFGSALQRRIVTFEPLVDPGRLPAIKHRTNHLEESLAVQGKRTVNIDPGYVSLGKMVLASTKDHAHRLYLGLGIYGEATLVYQRGRHRPWPWTYPDYASERYCAIFDQIRLRYREQLREREG
jgi:hypothetical protein